jgi:uncharacterized protein YkwD
MSRRSETVARLVVSTALVAAAAALVSPTARGAPTVSLRPVDALERPVDVRVDALRRRAGLAPVRHSAELTRAAEAHARMLARSGTFSHRSPGEKAFSRRLQSFYSARGFTYWATGENIFWCRSAATAAKVVRAWVKSPPHRANLLDRRWREVGVAAYSVAGAPGVYGGQDVTIVVIEFGTRTR